MARNRFLEEIDNLRKTSANENVPRAPPPITDTYQPPGLPNTGYPAHNYQPNPYNPYAQPGPYPQGYPNAYPGAYPNYPYPNYPYPPYPGAYPYPPPPPQQGEDPETQMLMKKIKKLKKQLKSQQNDEFYNSIQDGLKSLQHKITHPNERAPENQSRPPEDLLPEERALKNVMQQEQNELRLLAALPKNSELYSAKMEHYKEMTQIRMRMEAMLQELALNRMKRNFEREMDLEDKKFENEKWIEDQKKAILSSKMPDQQSISRNEGSIILHWDFVLGIPSKFKHCQLVYGIYEHGQERLQARLVQKVPLELEAYKSPISRALFATEHEVNKLQANPALSLIVEIQVTSENKTIQFGWTILDIFTASRQINEGMFKLPIYKPPTDTALEIRDIRRLAPVQGAFLYGRLGSPGSRVFQMAVNPDNTSAYGIPASHGAPVSPMSSRGSMGGGSFVPPRSGGGGINTLANNGISVRIEKLLSFITKSHIRFQVTLQLESQIAVDREKNRCTWVSEPVNAFGTGTGSGPSKTKRIPGTHIRAGNADLRASDIDSNARASAGMRSSASDGHNVVDARKEISFFNNFYDILHRMDWNQNMYLIIEVLEKSAHSLSSPDFVGDRASDLESYFPVAWAVLQLSNPDERILNFGTLELNLFELPVTVPVNDPRSLRQKEGTIEITVFEPTEKLKSEAASRRPGSLSSLKPKSRMEAFLENLTPQIEDAKYYEKGDGIDFYIDAARFLPDNTSCTKVLVKAFTSNIEKVGQSVGGLPDLNSSAYSPIFGFRTEFRKPIFDPTTTIVVTLLTIDTSHNEERVLGYTAINMFVNKMRTDQPANPNDQDFIVNKGNFQMPIYCQEPYRKPPFGISSFKKLETIPCATLLIRIREAPKADNGLRVLSMKDVLPAEWYIRGIVIPPPKYEERSYNTSSCMPSNVERYLYEERLNRKDLTVKDATCQIQNQLGIRLNLIDEELLKWIDQRLQVTPRTPMIDMKYFAKYNPKLGFKVAIDSVHNTPTDDPHVIIFCLNPPGALYSSTVITEDVMFTTKVEWNSSIKTPQFLDGFHTYKNILFDRNLHLIIDVRSVNFSKQRPEVVSVGWTLLPIFSSDGYVQSGIYQLPVFKGTVPASFLPDLATSDPWTLLMNSVTKPGGPVFLEPVSVNVRLVDTQRDGHFIVPMDVNRITYDYIPEELKPKLAYNAAAQAKAEQQRRLKSLVPGNFSPETYLKRVNEAVANVSFI